MTVSRETVTRLNEYAALVQRWTSRINLVSPNDRPHLWSRHIEDSLQLAPLLPPHADRAIDLGSGAGFPGLVLAIATGVHFDLVESDQRKAAFLREAIRVTGASAAVLAQRIETLKTDPVTLITARAVAALPKLCGLIAPLLAPNGHALVLKGQSAAAELTAAAKEWHMTVRQWPSRTSSHGTVLDITGLHRVGSIF
jgi:16S rRNA (guanine527-N7)-methyltransferase